MITFWAPYSLSELRFYPPTLDRFQLSPVLSRNVFTAPPFFLPKQPIISSALRNEMCNILMSAE